MLVRVGNVTGCRKWRRLQPIALMCASFVAVRMSGCRPATDDGRQYDPKTGIVSVPAPRPQLARASNHSPLLLLHARGE